MSPSFSKIFQSNSGYVEEMFARFSANAASVSPEWRSYFEGFDEGFQSAASLIGNTESALHEMKAIALSLQEIQQSAQPGGAQVAKEKSSGIAPSGTPSGTSSGTSSGPSSASSVASLADSDVAFEFACAQLVQTYRYRGHLAAHINPLQIPRSHSHYVSLNSLGFSDADQSRTTRAGQLLGISQILTLQELHAELTKKFCGTVGSEFEHIDNPEERTWLYEASAKLTAQPSAQSKRAIYEELVKADALEKTIATKFIGKKRFSIEGADAQIPALESYFDAMCEHGAEEFCVAMAHRGRLNMLVHNAGKPLEVLFSEFEGYPSTKLRGDWDVKYHSGWEAQRTSRSGKPMRVAISFNPSHLEFVDAVVMGETRAKQTAYYGGDKSKVVPVCFHGDAAFAGQGVVYETIQMMSLDGFGVGGCLHIIANNQVGFTTNPSDSRSTQYSSDLGRAFSVPIFHVNADDLNSLHNLMELCAAYRVKFKKDVIVNLLCFRRHGHNETDEPRFTQPLLYKIIDAKKPPYETYMAQLVAEGGSFQETDLKEFYAQTRLAMNAVYDNVKDNHTQIVPLERQRHMAKLKLVHETEILEACITAASLENLKKAGTALTEVPPEFHVHPKLQRIIMNERNEMLQGNKNIDWGFGELLAYGTLLQEGFSVRLTGQDARRGTFSHRHGTLVDSETAQFYSPLSKLLVGRNDNVRFEIFDSFLSETAAMGFEYGHSVQQAKTLTIWEGQFGDFANGAQVIIDQFLASGETKWSQSNGLVLLLPHGFEGQGPEHSSARLERFLQLCAQGNMQVCYFTNVAQLFHALRRQVLRDFRKPLVVMTPKSFLRNPLASTTFEELAKGSLQEILDDARFAKGSKAKLQKIVLCSGKVGLDLMDAATQETHAAKGKNTAILRVEQLYPLHTAKLQNILQNHLKNTSAEAEVVWCQEEPANMGAYSYIAPKLQALLQRCNFNGGLTYVGRSERASPAVGLEKAHAIEQEKIVSHVFQGKGCLEV